MIRQHKTLLIACSFELPRVPANYAE